MATHKHKERAFSCAVCFACITVVGPDTKVDAALRRVDWERRGNEVICRACLKDTAHPVGRELADHEGW